MYSKAAIKQYIDVLSCGELRGDREAQIRVILKLAELTRILRESEESRKPFIIQLINDAKTAYKEAKGNSYRAVLEFLKKVLSYKKSLVKLGLSKVVEIAGKTLRPIVLALLLRSKSHGDSKLMLTDSKTIKRYIDKAVARELMRRRVDEAWKVKKANKSDGLPVRRKRKDGPSDIALKAVLNVEYALHKIKSLIGDSEWKAKAIWNDAVNAVKSSKVANKGYDKIASLLDKLKQTVLDNTARRLTQKAIDAINEVTNEEGPTPLTNSTARGVHAARHLLELLAHKYRKLPFDIANEVDPDNFKGLSASPWKYVRKVILRAVNLKRKNPNMESKTAAMLDEIIRVAENALKEMKSYGDIPKSK